MKPVHDVRIAGVQVLLGWEFGFGLFGSNRDETLATDRIYGAISVESVGKLFILGHHCFCPLTTIRFIVCHQNGGQSPRRNREAAYLS